MANTTADKLALLEATKADLKAALAEKGQTVGDVFSTYPAAVRAIETGGVNAESVPVVFSTSDAPSDIHIIYTTVENGNVVYKDETKYGGGGTIYALKGSILYCTAYYAYATMLNISSGGTTVVSGMYQDIYAKYYDFRVYQVTG